MNQWKGIRRRCINGGSVRLAAGMAALAATAAPALADRTWDRGAGDNFWTSAANWNPDGLPTSADNVTLTDTGAVAVDLNGTTQPARGSIPGVTFNNATSAFTLQNGTINAGGLTQSAGASVTNTISTRLNLTGGTGINSGKLVLSNVSNSISGPVSISAGATLDLTAPTSKSIGAVALSGGTLLIRGATGDLSGSSLTVTANSVVDVQSTAGTVGAVSFNSGTTLTTQGAGTAATGVLSTTTGTATLTTSTPTTAAGVSLGGTSFIKNGPSRLSVNSAGTGTGPVSVQAGTLGGTGSIAGPVSVPLGGTVAPGNSIGTFGTENFSIAAAGATVGIEIDPTNSGGLGTADNLNVTGTVALTGGNLSVAPLATPTVGQQFQIITNDGSEAVTGTFSTANGVPVVGNSFTVSGFRFAINYAGGTGNDVILTVTSVPEPTGLALLGLATAGLMIRRRLINGHGER